LTRSCEKKGLFEAEQLVRDLKELGHNVSRATVYRTLSHLHDAGILKQVFFDNKQSYYEVIAGGHPNDYLICVETGRVIEFNSEKLRELRDEICRQHGFEPLSHQFHIYGISPQGKITAAAKNDGAGKKQNLGPAARGCPRRDVKRYAPAMCRCSAISTRRRRSRSSGTRCGSSCPRRDDC